MSKSTTSRCPSRDDPDGARWSGGKGTRTAGRAAGFTLPEVLIAVVILVLGVVSVTFLSSTILRMNEMSGQVTEGTAIGQSQVDALLDMDYGAIASGSRTSSIYAVAWNIAEDAALKLKTVDVSVSWMDGGGRPHQLNMKSMINAP
jgi:prepilin-type N-terminal cleavage/methylation domain-containing protein